MSIRTLANLRGKRGHERSKRKNISRTHIDAVDIKSRFENRKTTL